MRTGLRSEQLGPVVKGAGPGCEFGKGRCASTGVCERACAWLRVCVCVGMHACSAPVRGEREWGDVRFVFVGGVEKWNGLVQCLERV